MQAMIPTDTTQPTRDRLVAAMADTLQTRGLNGRGLTEILTQAQAPKGVLYHHFPGGKQALAVAAIEALVAQMLAGLDSLFTHQPDPLRALVAWVGRAQQQLAQSQFERGCPLATVALESTPDDQAIRAALSTGFARIRQRLALALTAGGLEAARANSLATLVIAAYEGGLIQARVAGHTQPMQDTADSLIHLLQLALTSPPTGDTP